MEFIVGSAESNREVFVLFGRILMSSEFNERKDSVPFICNETPLETSRQ